MSRTGSLPTLAVAAVVGLLATALAASAVDAEQAATRFEAEAMSTRSVGGPDGPAWNLWSNGHVADEFTVAETGPIRFVVHVRSRSESGTAPLMELSIDGQTVDRRPVPPGGRFQDYTFVTEAAAGDHEFAIAFVNDAARPDNDMDLIVDWIEVRAGSGRPQDPSSTSTTEVGRSTLVVTTIGPTTTTTTPDRPVTTTAPPTSTTTSSVQPTTTTTSAPRPVDEEENLARLRRSSVRNTNHDQSPHRDTAQAQLELANHFGPRSDYLGNPGGNPEQHYPTVNGGNFRVSCEFSHFAYDDPIVFPSQPGRAHLHMFFGNTDANAFSTFASLRDRGSGTCNGQELNRTSYWAPAMFDADGNVRIPNRISVYYKGYGMTRGRAQVYPDGAAMIASEKVHETPGVDGGSPDQVGFRCTNQYRGNRNPDGDTIPRCVGNAGTPYRTLEMVVKFPQCWNGADPTDPDNFHLPKDGSGYGWFRSDCGTSVNLPNIEYLISYPLAADETTDGWYLSSDIDMRTGRLSGAPGASHHADWLGAWHPEVNQMFIDNCVNYRDGAPSGCGNGYLTNAGPDNRRPAPGPALRMRPQYDGPIKVSAATLFEELCETDRRYTRPEDATHCNMR